MINNECVIMSNGGAFLNFNGSVEYAIDSDGIITEIKIEEG